MQCTALQEHWRIARAVLGLRCAIAIRPSAIFFPKPESDFAALGRRRAFPLGRSMSVIGGDSEVSALREFFAVSPVADVGAGSHFAAVSLRWRTTTSDMGVSKRSGYNLFCKSGFAYHCVRFWLIL